MKKILLSLLSIGVVTTVSIMATKANFFDEERSVGNMFTAGTIDLTVDNTCHYNGKVCAYDENKTAYLWEGTEEECFCTWEKKDLNGELLFNLLDVMPGDYGEDTISLHVDSDDAWVCAEIANLTSDDNGCKDPENEVDATCGEGEGEMKENILFTVWEDLDCNNILDGDETPIVTDETAIDGNWPIADASTGGGPLEGGSDFCLGVSWRVPIETSNIIQTDSLKGDIIFTAVQADNLDDFTCSGLQPFPTGIITPTPVPTVGCESNIECNDNNFCTNDYCDAQGTCQLYCNGTDTCNLGTCSAHSGDPCTGPDNDIDCSESCNESSNDCTADDQDTSACLGGSCFDGQCIISSPTSAPAPVVLGSVWINEIHYENISTDANEGFEIAGPAGTDLTGWKLFLYNGLDGSDYQNVNMSGTIPNEENGFGTRWFSVGSVQNGPDGVALVNPDYIVVQFLSYEGSFDARWGPAIGTTSVDIGVFESGITSSDHSLQLTGSGNSYNDFSWAGPVTESRGSVNTGQTFVSVP